jgi:hypothetical protein
MTEELEVKSISVDLLDRDPDIQPRATLNREKITEFSDHMKEGVVFPPIDVFLIEGRYLIVDGYHRDMAARGAGIQEIRCRIHIGTRRDAILLSSGTNWQHGIDRTTRDKRRAVERLINDPEWSKWSSREISRHCHVSVSFVENFRPVPVTVHVDSDNQSGAAPDSAEGTDNTTPAKPDQESEKGGKGGKREGAGRKEKRKFVNKQGNETEMRVDKIGKSRGKVQRMGLCPHCGHRALIKDFQVVVRPA